MAAPVIQFKRGQFANLPGLRAGEPGFTTDKYDLYVGIDSTTSNNKFFGSHRYWTKETGTTGSAVRVVEGSDNGENYIELASPASLASNVTYTLPGTIVENGYLVVDSSGNLSWDDTLDATSVNATGVGTVAFLQSTTVNVSAGATVTGALDVDGGANIASGLTVSGGLTLTGSQTADQVSVSGVVTATSFVGDLTGDVTGDVTGNLTGNVTGDVTGDVTGNADTATQLATARNFSASGDATAPNVSFDGSGNVDLALTLANSGVTAGTVGSATEIPVVTVDAKGRVTSTSTASIVTTLTVDGDSGSEDIALATEDLTISGGTNVTTTAASNGVSVALDDDISLTTVTTSGAVTANSVSVTNDAVVSGDVRARNVSASGVTTSTAGFVGNLTGNVTGDLTGEVNAAAFDTNAEGVVVSGIATATSFSGSGAGLSDGTVPALAIDIDGATDIGADLVDADLFLVDDGAGGTNRKATMSRVKDYVLGGGAGANFAAINVSGIATVTYADATTLKVGAGATVTGALDVDGGLDLEGGADIAGGLVANSAQISDLTDGRVVLAGTNGELEDSANLIFGDNGLAVNGDAIFSATPFASGIVTATSFATGAEGSAIIVNSETITGPSSITIDPSAIGDNTGTVYILGDLQVDGTQTIINSTSVTVSDLNVMLADGAANDAAANGGGITVQSGDGNKTFQFEATGDNFGSSENINLASGKVLKINNTEVLSASALSNAVVVNVASVDIDGATAIGEDIADGDLFLVDNGADGTNRKTTASDIKDYVLGGGAGANFAAINVSGIATVTYADATTLKVGAGATVTGALDVDGGADIAGGATVAGGLVANSAQISDLTDGRVVLAGASGELEDSGNLTFDGSTLAVTGDQTVSGDLTVSGDAGVRHATASGIVTATGGFIGDVTGDVTGDLTGDVSGNISGAAGTFSSYVHAADFRDTDGSLVPLVGVSSASAHTGLVTAFKFVGTGLEEYSVENEVATIRVSGVAASTYTTSATTTATEGQTSFGFAPGYTEGFVDVYLNGIRLITGTDYTANDAANVVLATGATAGDEVEIVSFKELGDLIHVQSLKSVDNLTAGIITATQGIHGNIQATGISTLGNMVVGSGSTDVILNGDLQVTNTIKIGNSSIVLDGSSDNITAATATFSGTATANAFTGDLTGDVTGDLTGNADTATQLATSRNFSASGDATASAVGFDGSGNVDLALTLANSGVTAATYGSTTAVPVITVDAKGRITSATTAAVGTALTVTGDSGSEDINLLNETLSITGGSNLTSTAASNGVSVALDNDISLTSVTASGAVSAATVTASTSATLASAAVSDLTSGRVVLAGTSGELEDSASLTFDGSTLTADGDLSISGGATIGGDLTVNGTLTSINSTNTTIEDTLLELQRVDGGALSSDTNKDVGLVMNYYDGSAKKAAVYWDDSAGRFVFGEEVSESSGVLTASTYGGLEVGSLYLNDCAGASQVISCSGTTRSLENITIDGGSF